MSDSSRLAAFLLLGTAVVTWGLYGIVRPSPPERMKVYSGPIGFLGRWAYWVSRPLLRAAAALHLSANAITAVGTLITVAAGGLAAVGEWAWAGFLLVFGSWCDLLDGEIARSTQTQGKAGAFLDSNLDRLAEAALFFGLAAGFPDRRGLFAALVASLLVSYARARGEGLGVDCPAFGWERPHRLALVIFALLVAPFLPAARAVPTLELVSGAVAVGAGLTALGRILVIRRILLSRTEGR